MRFSGRRDGLRITVFTAPNPLRAGPVDVSVLVQDASGRPLTDVPVAVRAHPAGDPARQVSGPATAEAATNKLLLAAPLEFGEPGRWRVEVGVMGPGGTVRIDFDVEVAEAPPPWLNLSLWVGWPFAAVLLFAAHRRLTRRRRPGRPRPGPPQKTEGNHV